MRRDIGSVAIVGTGQIGTMLGIALRRSGPEFGVGQISLSDSDPEAARFALELGAGDRVVSLDDISDAHVAIVAVPMDRLPQALKDVAERLRPGAVVMDTGSAKKSVVECMRRVVPPGVRAIGAHPMAGTHIRGPAGARPELLASAAFVLTPVKDDSVALQTGRSIAAAVGARPVVMDAEQHDRLMARTSHLAHLASFALAGAGGSAAAEAASYGITSSGFTTTTRLARSDAAMVAGFLKANADEVGAGLDDLMTVLAGLRRDLGAGDLAERLSAMRGEAGSDPGE